MDNNDKHEQLEARIKTLEIAVDLLAKVAYTMDMTITNMQSSSMDKGKEN